MESQQLVLGVDIGGSHITCLAFDLQKNQPIQSTLVRNTIDNSASKEKIINDWGTAIIDSVNKSPSTIKGIGFAMPGPFDYHNGIAKFEGVAKFNKLFNVNIKNELLNKLNLTPIFPIRFLNDASCFAIGETNFGEAKKYNRIISLTLGTGFGTTFIADNLPVSGVNGIPSDGFLYHIPFQDSIADDYFSTRWFINEYKRNTSTTVTGVKQLASFACSNADAKKVFQQFGNYLGEFLSPWVNSFNADCIVIGGNISKSYHLFQETLNLQLKQFGTKIPIVISKLEEEANLYGAAKLCDDYFYQKLTSNKKNKYK